MQIVLNFTIFILYLIILDFLIIFLANALYLATANDIIITLISLMRLSRERRLI